MGQLHVQAACRDQLGQIAAVILDWAGTTVDHGCMAPAQVFREIFHLVGVDVTEAEAREPMGQAKKDHIRSMLAMPRIQAQWSQRYGRNPTDEDVDDLYATFLPMQKEILAKHSDVIPGVGAAIRDLRRQGQRVGSTTGYTRELMDVVEPMAEAQGYQPEVTICSDEVASGRPAPWQIYRAAESLGVFPMQRILIVDDSLAGIQAGHHAGCWTAAVSATGNAMGLSVEDLARLAPEERQARIDRITQEFLSAGAHVVVESVADLPELFR